MPRVGPIARRDLVSALRRAGFSEPSGPGAHQIMERDGIRLAVPNPHRGDISTGLLLRLLKQAGVTREE